MSKRTGTNKITAWLLTLAMLMTVLSGFSITAFATETANGTCGENLRWKLDDAGTLTISGTGAMADYGMNENWNPWKAYEIKAVVIENGVTTIGNYAFVFCPRLTSVTIPESVTTIGSYAFAACSSITSVTIPKGVETIGAGAFSNCGRLTSVTIPEGVKTIGIGAFAYCSSLTSITIPEGVKTIGNLAFAYCSSITSVTIPSSVEAIGMYAFTMCTSLKTFAVSEDNRAYSSIDGALFTKDEKTLIKLPPKMDKSEYIIPDGTVTIESLAFEACSSLTSVTIPESVTAIGTGAF